MGADDEKAEKRSRLEALWFRADAWEEVRRFFRDVVGLKEVHVDDAEGWAQFSTDAGPAIHVMRGGLPGQPRGVPVVGLRFSELETLHERLVSAGVEVDVRRGDPGITRLRFGDPEGHRFAASGRSRTRSSRWPSEGWRRTGPDASWSSRWARAGGCRVA